MLSKPESLLHPLHHKRIDSPHATRLPPLPAPGISFPHPPHYDLDCGHKLSTITPAGALAPKGDEERRHDMLLQLGKLQHLITDLSHTLRIKTKSLYVEESRPP